MFTLRPLPGAAWAHPNPVLRLYYEGLLAHWGASDRLAGRLLAAAVVGRRGPERRRWLGIPANEWALADGRLDPEQMLTMQARKGLHRLINACAIPLRTSVLKNKHRFAAAAAAHGLPVPPALRPGEDPREWVERCDDIVLKPNFSSKGTGIRRFSRQAGSAWAEESGPLPAPDLLTLISQTVREGGLVQAALGTHPALAAISPGALPTMRIVSMRNERGSIEIAARILRVGGGLAPVDNFNRGGLAAIVDERGGLGPFFRHVPSGPPQTVPLHPASEATFPANLPLDLHEDVDRLASDAHARMTPDYRIVGWDIGLAPDGAILIEGNWNPGINVTQLLSGRSVLEGRSGELYRHALGQVRDEVWRTARPIEPDNPRGRS